ncbi:DUF2271 domain-containing protein [Sporolactobacillus kofuensis]|uniref:DUF2271 domain-containing protein n=1 Tax=Sporolactobacillus kofuensis TaxID=269672 RepID=A0ABW1WFM0_9BACL|nr:DUF2271 domain-containing protein [Sporolactobacillus kofuensis]MCO7175141.1 DUF2271 domain-containing protein [Sporolactobacillus kofuensis]
MKKILAPVVGTLGAGVIILSGISNFTDADNPFSSSYSSSASDASPLTTPSSKTNTTNIPDVKTLGLVAINYKLFHLDQLASNQIAFWIEDDQGHYVKTLRASSFTAGGGYKIRPDALPEWRKISNWSKASKAEVERVKLPEQGTGNHVIYWDCTDASGKAVKPGTYIYKAEGNIYWQNRVIFTGKLTIGKKNAKSTAQVVYKPADARSHGVLLENVHAGFDSGKSIAAVKQDPATRTQGS